MAIYIFNLVDINKSPCYPHRRSTTVSLETFTLYSLRVKVWDARKDRKIFNKYQEHYALYSIEKFTAWRVNSTLNFTRKNRYRTNRDIARYHPNRESITWRILQYFISGITQKRPTQYHSLSHILARLEILAVTLPILISILAQDVRSWGCGATGTIAYIGARRVTICIACQKCWFPNTRKHLKPRGRRPSGFIVFECLETWWNPKHEFLKLLLQRQKLEAVVILMSFLKYSFCGS